jgi:hypothetical protein
MDEIRLTDSPFDISLAPVAGGYFPGDYWAFFYLMNGHRVAGMLGKKVWFYYLSSRLLGLTFSAKLMESREVEVQHCYAELEPVVRDIDHLIHDEQTHERALIDLLDEESLRYAGSIVLGLNDALVKLTGRWSGTSPSTVGSWRWLPSTWASPLSVLPLALCCEACSAWKSRVARRVTALLRNEG